MSTLPDGQTVCDRCGADCGNGSLFNCVVVADRTDDAQVVNLHFCRKATDDAPDMNDCARRILSKANVADLVKNGRRVGVATPA